MALRAARELSLHYSGVSESIRRLSSGLRVQNAADDAAGLAISEMAKARAATLMQAKRNIQDGASMVQVADGALASVDAQLIRLKELAVQASTGTYNSDQRLIISNEMQQITSEIERAQKALRFNGIDIFKHDSTVEIQSGEMVHDNIMVELPKVTATTLGAYMPDGLKSYEIAMLDGVKLDEPVVGATLVDAVSNSFADQTITIRNSPDIRTITISAERGNNTVQGVLAEIENLEMDGIRETSAITYANLVGFSKAWLNGTTGDMVKFDVNVGGTAYPNFTHSFLIGFSEAETQANFGATLDRIVAEINTDNGDLDLYRDGTMLVSRSGRTISIGNFEFIDNPGMGIGDFGGTAATPSGYTPESRIYFEIDGREVSFLYSNNPAINMTRLENAIEAEFGYITDTPPGLIYDYSRYAIDSTYPPPHECEHCYTLATDVNTNRVILTKINLNSTESPTAAGNLIEISEFRNNLTQITVGDFQNYAGEEITLTIDPTDDGNDGNGTDVTFIAAGTGNQLENANRLVQAIQDANISGIDAYRSGNNVVITRVNSEEAIRFVYSDEDNNVRFTNYSDDIGAIISLDIDGTNIEYTVGGNDTDTAISLEGDLNANLDLNVYTIDRNGSEIKISRTDNVNISITNFQDDGINGANLGPISGTVDGEIVKFTYTQGGSNYDVEFYAGANDGLTAQNMRNALNSLGIANTTFTVDGTSVRTENSSNTNFQISNIHSVNEVSLGDFTDFTPGETISFTYRQSGTDYSISFTAGATDADTANNLHQALSNNGYPGATYTLEGTSVRIRTGNDASFSFLNLAGTAGPNVSLLVTPGAGTDAGGGAGIAQVFSEGGGSISLSDATASYSMDVRPIDGSDAGGGAQTTMTLNEGGGIITVRDINSDIMVTPGPGSSLGLGSGVGREIGQTSGRTGETITDLATRLTIGGTVLDRGAETTQEASRATASVYSLEAGTLLVNTALGISRTNPPFMLREDDADGNGDEDHLTLDRINDDLRRVGIEQVSGYLTGWIDSQHDPASQNKWVSIGGIGQFVLDPNIMFSISSDVAGDSGSGVAGAFDAKANEPANLRWQSSGPTVKAKIHDFVHQDGETITFSINGISVSYTTAATQRETVNNLMLALDGQQSALTASRIRFAKTANEEGVYLYQLDAEPLKISGFSAGSGEENSGFSVWNIDSPMNFELNSSNTSAEIASWTSLSQMNYKMQEGAQTALDIIERAIIVKDSVRGLLGATQNVLDNHKTFTEISHENTIGMISRIIDADIAKEMTEYVRKQILAQAATAMLVQANSIPKIALELIRG